MREEMYVPGQDDFPGWDEFYAAQNARVSRWRYSVKTLMILPPLVAFVSLAYSLGYQNGNSQEIAQFNQIQTESQARQAAERLAALNAEIAASAGQAVQQSDEQNRLAMATLLELLADLDWQSQTMADGEEFAAAIRATAFEGLRKAALQLPKASTSHRTTPDEDQALVAHRLDLGRAFILLRSASDKALELAKTQFDAAEDVAQTAFAVRPNDLIAQRNVILAHVSSGDFNRQWGRASSAAESYQAAANAAERIVQLRPADPKAARTLVACYSNLADMQLQLGSLEAARTSYQAALKALAEQAKTDPRNTDLKNDVALLNGKLGDVYLQSDGIAEARDEPQLEFGIFPERLTIGSSTEGLRLDRFVVYERISDAHRQAANAIEAQNAYQTSFTILKLLLQDDPEDLRASLDLVHAKARIAHVNMAIEDFPAAKKSLEEALARLGPKTASSSNDAAAKVDLWRTDLKEKLASCETVLKAVDDLEFLLHKPMAEIGRLLGIRGRVLARTHRAIEAMATAERLTTLEPVGGERLFAAAEIYALTAAGLVEQGARPGDAKAATGPKPMSPAERKDLHERAIKMALVCLNRAAGTGFWDDSPNSDAITTDNNLSALFGLDEFDAVVKRVNKAIAERKEKAPK